MSSNPKKYLSLEETAARLSVSRDQLIRMRENGDIRGFADRGTWKFRQEDVDEFARTRQADSDPDVQMFGDSGPMVIGDEVAESGSSTILAGGDVSDDPTVIRKGEDSGAASDSDVKLVGADSDSDVTLARDPASSDSDVKLIPDSGSDDSDSDVQLIDQAAAGEDSSDSDVALIGTSDSTVALDMPSDDDEQASVLSDDSGLALDSGSSLTLAADSGISLEADEGISLSADSGISLEGIGDSGISLEDSNEFGGTVPMMDAVPQVEGVEETKFEIPAVQDESAFDLKMEDQGQDDTGVIDLGDSSEQALDDAVFDVDDDEDLEDDELEVSADILGEDDELEDLDIFDADEGLFEESGVSQEFAAPVSGRPMAVEQEWGGGVVASLAVSSLLMVVATLFSFELVRSMWNWNEPSVISSTLLGLFGGS